MSHRAVSNLERILASINFKEDDIVVTPEPRLGDVPRIEVVAIPAKVREDTSSSFASRCNSPLSDEDVPLTVELLTPKVNMDSIQGFGKFGLGSTQESKKPTIYKTHDEEESCKDLDKHRVHIICQRFPSKKNGLPFKLPASSESLLEYDATSDGLDAYQEREKDGRRVVRLKKKPKKRHGGDFKYGKKRRETHDTS